MAGVTTRRTMARRVQDENNTIPTRATRQTAKDAAASNGASAVGPSKAAVASSASSIPSAALASKSSNIPARSTNVLGTRKRAALGDLTNAGKTKLTTATSKAGQASLKAGDKGKAAAVAARAPLTTKSATDANGAARKPLASRATRASVQASRADEMAVDDDDAATSSSRPVARRAAAATSSRTASTTSKASVATAASRTARTGAQAGISSRKNAARPKSATTAARARQGRGEEETVEGEANGEWEYDEAGDVGEEGRVATKRLKTESASIDNAATADPSATGAAGPQVRAKDEGWEDLDAEDADDPLMVAEYVNDIFEYMKILEVNSMPSPTYMDQQKELEWNMRGVLVDWLIEVHAKFRLLPETLFLAVNIVDRFLSVRIVTVGKFQLVGVTAMFIAAKYEEVIAPSVQNFLYLADGGYTDDEILDAERYMLTVLNFDLSYANPMNFLRRISKADNYDIQTRTVAKYFMEISAVDYRLLKHKPSALAAASVWLARRVLERGEWNANLVHYSGYSEAELLKTANVMLDYVLRPVAHESFFKKYASKKFMKASAYVREWAKRCYPEATVRDSSDAGEDLGIFKVDLFVELGIDEPESSDESDSLDSRSRPALSRKRMAAADGGSSTSVLADTTNRRAPARSASSRSLGTKAK